jgi:IAA-amino acid hydrolase
MRASSQAPKPSKILLRAHELAPALVDIRRTLHRNPELGFEERCTAALVASKLHSLGIRVETNVGITGVVGHIGTEGPIVALRADMDALPIQELNKTPYASEVPGIMHACGHDAHTACLLGAATILQEIKLDGQVRLIFQPSEEGVDREGKSGAMRMVEEGVADGVQAFFALHVDSNYQSGHTGHGYGGTRCPGLSGGRCSAAGIPGNRRAAHSRLAAHFASGQRRHIDRPDPRRDKGEHSGRTGRAARHGSQLQARGAPGPAPRNRPRVWDNPCCGLSIRHGYPALHNDPSLTAFAVEALTGLIGSEALLPLEPEMGSEDFSFFAQRAPACYMSLGVRFPGQPMRPAHHPSFDIDESALPLGAASLVHLAVGYLNARPHER